MSKTSASGRQNKHIIIIQLDLVWNCINPTPPQNTRSWTPKINIWKLHVDLVWYGRYWRNHLLWAQFIICYLYLRSHLFKCSCSSLVIIDRGPDLDGCIDWQITTPFHKTSLNWLIEELKKIFLYQSLSETQSGKAGISSFKVWIINACLPLKLITNYTSH